MKFSMYFIIATLMLGVLIVIVAGVRGQRFQKPPMEFFPDMDRQLKKKAQKPSDFFADGRVARPQVPGTVPVGYEFPTAAAGAEGRQVAGQPAGSYAVGGSYFDTGAIGDYFGDGIPVPVTTELIERGRERYEINCAVCHSSSGLGNGTASPYWGGAPIANLHDQRIVDMPDGQLYYTIANGKGVAPIWTMFPYKDKINVEDRWAIVAYMRAMQIGLSTPADTLPAGPRALLEQQVVDDSGASQAPPAEETAE